jgi:hypothetical protein
MNPKLPPLITTDIGIMDNFLYYIAAHNPVTNPNPPPTNDPIMKPCLA